MCRLVVGLLVFFFLNTLYASSSNAELLNNWNLLVSNLLGKRESGFTLILLAFCCVPKINTLQLSPVK